MTRTELRALHKRVEDAVRGITMQEYAIVAYDDFGRRSDVLVMARSMAAAKSQATRLASSGVRTLYVGDNDTIYKRDMRDGQKWQEMR